MVVRVEKCDSWQSIADQWQTTVEELQKDNQYTGALRAGMRLWVNANRYCIARQGDGWERIAARYGVRADALRRCNGETLYAGKRIQLPFADDNE